MKKHKPTTAARRHMSVVSRDILSRVEPEKSLLLRLPRASGRNFQGKITVRHRGGGHKKLYRQVDFIQEKMNREAIVETLEYDPYRTAFIAKVRYADGERRYLLAPQGLKAGDRIVAADSAPLQLGNRLRLKNIPIGYQVYNIELQPGGGGKLARAAGSYAEILGHSGGYTDLKLSSGEIRRVRSNCFASIGQVSNPEHNLEVIGKAGRSRWLGIRPTVRGSAMNPVDHPYGGGEGRAKRGTRRPKTRWGKVTGGRKTRKKRKWSDKLILRRRK